MCDYTQLLKFINVARQFPSYYISLIDRQLSSFLNDKQMPISEDVVYETNEGKKAWKEARRYLEKQTTLPPFEVHQGLNLSTRDHAADLVKHKIFGHTGSDKSSFSERILRHCKKGQGSMAEIIGADFNIEDRNCAEMTILSLIIDDGVADRGHRKTIFSPEYRYIGCKSAIQGDKIISIFNLTQNKLALKGQSSTSSYNQQAFNSTSPRFHETNRQQKTSSFNFHSTDPSNNFKKEVSSRSKDLPMFNQLSNNISIEKPSKNKNASEYNVVYQQEGKKITQKKQNTRIFHEHGAKVTEKYTKICYEDGTMEQNVEKHTVFT